MQVKQAFMAVHMLVGDLHAPSVPSGEEGEAGESDGLTVNLEQTTQTSSSD